MENNYSEHRKYHRGEDDARKLLYKFIQPWDSVLDVGCGSGWMYENLSNHGWCATYKGVDLTKNFIEGCRIDFPEAVWEVQDARYLKEKAKSFDVVTLYHVLEHMPSWRPAIEEALRVAKRLVIVTIWRGLSEEDSRHLRRYKDLKNYDYLKERLSNYISKDGFFHFLKERGFEDPPHHRAFDGHNWTDFFLLYKEK